MTLEEYFRKLHKEEWPDENQIVAALETATRKGIAPLDLLRSINEISKRGANGIVYSSRFAAEELEILLQGGFLKYIGKDIVGSVVKGNVLVITNLGKAATKLVNRCGDLLANCNPKRVTVLLMKEFKIIND